MSGDYSSDSWAQIEPLAQVLSLDFRCGMGYFGGVGCKNDTISESPCAPASAGGFHVHGLRGPITDAPADTARVMRLARRAPPMKAG